MQFEKGNLYHVYNQGNNRQKIFFNDKNYLFFLKKIRIHILPYADILAWCLMPNHFHIMLFVKYEELITTEGFASSLVLGNANSAKGIFSSEALGNGSKCFASNEAPGNGNLDDSKAPTNSHPKTRTFNQSIGIMLRAYTNAINKQNNTTGSLFRSKTKAVCLNVLNGITPSFYNTNRGTLIHIDDPVKQYPQACFNYIHNNPVKANLVKKETDWEYSSAKDYANLRNGNLVNKEKAKEYIKIT